MEIKNFAILEGNSVKINNGKIIYSRPKAIKSTKAVVESNELTKSVPEPPMDKVIIKSDANFGNGALSFQVITSTYESGMMINMTSFDNKEVKCGYSQIYKQFFIAVLEGNTWKKLSEAGSLSNYDLSEVLHFKIEVNGSQIQLLINNILMCSANIAVKETPIEFVLQSMGDIEIFEIKRISSSPKIFVVMQFTKEYDELFEEVILPVTKKYGYECIRADEYYTGTPILTDIIKSIQESTAIIAEITPDNPNVFYEIGYSHAIGKPTILLCDKKRDKLPFDLSGFRTLFYENTIAGKKKVEVSLLKYLENI